MRKLLAWIGLGTAVPFVALLVFRRFDWASLASNLVAAGLSTLVTVGIVGTFLERRAEAEKKALTFLVFAQAAKDALEACHAAAQVLLSDSTPGQDLVSPQRPEWKRLASEFNKGIALFAPQLHVNGHVLAVGIGNALTSLGEMQASDEEERRAYGHAFIGLRDRVRILVWKAFPEIIDRFWEVGNGSPAISQLESRMGIVRAAPRPKAGRWWRRKS